MIDAVKVEKLKVWYAVFTTLLDADQYSDWEKIAKLRELRKMIDLDIARPS